MKAWPNSHKRVLIHTMILVGCGQAPEATELEPTAPDAEHPDVLAAYHQATSPRLSQAESDAVLAEWEATRGAVREQDWQTTTPWGDLWGEPEERHQVDKVTGGQVVLHGWAVKAITAQLGDGRNHWIPEDTNYGDTNFLDWNRATRGRCGRLDGFRDNSFLPCVVPHGRNNGGSGKRKKWRFDVASCTNEGPFAEQRDIILSVMRDFVFADFGLFFGTSWDFNETTSPDEHTYTIYCASAQEKFQMDVFNAIAGGYPGGPISRSHYDGDGELANYIDVCTDPGDEGSEWNYLTDVFYYYKRGRIVLNWETMWNYIYGCAGSHEPTQRRALLTILSHEVLHTLGFQHQTDIVGNLMWGEKSCEILTQQFSSMRPYMKDTLNVYSLPVLAGETLQLWWENLACYSPAGPP